MSYRFHFFFSFTFIVLGITFGINSNVSFAVENSELNFSSGTYIPGYTNSKWSSWGKLGSIIGGAPIDPVNRWAGCDPHNPDLGCWSAVSTTFRCPEYAQVYEYAYDSVSGNYQFYAPFEFINSGDTDLTSQYLDLQKIRFERWEKCSASGSVVTPYGGQCGDGNVNIGEQCDPPGRTVLYDNSCPLGSYATATCNSSCQYEYGVCSASTAVCGNGRVDLGEACDAGSQNGQYGSRCTPQCQIATAENGQFCGNGTLDRNPPNTGRPLEFCEEVNGACIHIDETGQVLRSRVHIVLDRSGSMNLSVSGSSLDRWQNALSGLDQVYTAMSSNIDFSLSIFPGDTQINPALSQCYREFGLLTAKPSSVLSSAGISPGGQTPTKCAFSTVLSTQSSIFTNDQVPKKIVLITDGKPSDATTETAVSSIIKQLYDNNISTYVVGFSNLSSVTDHVYLNSFAEAGGTDNPDSVENKFYYADKANEFVAAFNEFLGCFEYSKYKQNSCSWDCQNYGQYCGDGMVQQQHGEECEISLSSPGACDAYCKLTSGPPPVCGNTQVEAGEQCDDGNVINGDECSTTCLFESSTAACGNGKVETVNGIPEQCDLGSENGLVCDPQYDNSCTYCSNACEIITLESDSFCGNGRVDDINATLREACDYIGDDAVTSTGIVLQCPDKGNYTCSNSCLQLTPNCVTCGTLATPPIPKISILNPLVALGNFPANYDVAIRSFRRNAPLPLLGTTIPLQPMGDQTFLSSQYVSPLTPINLFSDTKGIEADLACNGEYALLFNKQRLSPVLNDLQVVLGGLGDLFNYEVHGEGTEVVNEVVTSPAIPQDAIRIVTRWKKKPSDRLFMGEFYQDKTDQSSSENGNTFSYFNNVNTSTSGAIVQDNNYNDMEFLGGYWQPTRPEVAGYPTTPGVYVHKFLNPGASKTAIQGVTLYANTLSSNKPIGFYVASPNGPINQFKDYELWVDVYEYHAGQIPQHSIYRPVHSFSLGDAVPNANPVARYWHVFNLSVDGSGAQKKLSVLPITGANSGLIVTNQCDVRKNMPGTTQCDGNLTPLSSSILNVFPDISVPATAGSNSSISVNSNIEWIATADQPWITSITPSSGASGSTNLTVTYTANTLSSARTSIITVAKVGGGITRTVTVTQAGSTQTTPQNQLSVPANINLGASQNSVAYGDVVSNINWIVSHNVPWLLVSPPTGSNNGTLTFTATETNTDVSDRTGVVTVMLAGGGITRNITVTQAGGTASYLTVPTPAKLGSTRNSSQTVTVDSNVTWSFSESLNWLNVTRSGNQVTFTTTNNASGDNPSTSDRTGQVTFTGAGVPSQTITVTQAGTAVVNTLTLSTSALNPGVNSGGTQVGVTSNVTWTVSSDQSWLTVTPISGSNNGTIGVTYSANTGSNRVGIITVTGGGITRTVTVTQAGTNASLSVSPASIALGPAANSNDTFTITSNVAWTATDNQSWLTINQVSGTGDTTIGVRAISENTAATSRTATVTVSAAGVPSQTVTITQAGVTQPTASLSISPSSVSLAAAANSTSNNSVSVSSNVSWSVSDDQSWLTVTPISGSNNGTLSFTATSANTASTPRTATVTVRAAGLSDQVITVTQLGTAASLTVPSSVNVGSALGSNTSVVVTSNVNWSVSDNETWLTVSPISGSNNGNFVITASQANTSASSRTGTVTVSGGGIIRVITVTQAAANSLSITPAISNVGTAAGTINFTVRSNVSWTVSDDATWISGPPLSGSNDGNFSITYQSNTSVSPRTGTITITGGGITRTVVVNQGFLTATPATINVGPAAGSGQTFTVSSDRSWSVSDNANWLAASVTNGSNNQTVTVSYNENPGASRTGVITITDGGVSRTVTVTQGFFTVTPSPLNLDVVCDTSDKLSITSNAGGNWTISENLSWVGFNPTTGANNPNTAQASVFCTDNNTTAIQSGNITVTGGGVSRTIPVNQNFLHVNRTVMNVPATFSSFSVTVSSNLDWGITTSDGSIGWGSINSINTQTFNINVGANLAGSPARTMYIRITGGGVTRTITVNQAAG